MSKKLPMIKLEYWISSSQEMQTNSVTLTRFSQLLPRSGSALSLLPARDVCNQWSCNSYYCTIVTRYQIAAQKHIKITAAFHHTSIMQSSDNYNLTPICLMPRLDMVHRKLLLEPRDHEGISPNTACLRLWSSNLISVTAGKPTSNSNTHDTYKWSNDDSRIYSTFSKTLIET